MKEEKKSGNGAAFPRATERERGGQRGEGSTVPVRPCARPSAGSNGLGSLVPILRVSAGCGAQPPNSIRTTPRRELSGEREFMFVQYGSGAEVGIIDWREPR